MAFISEIHYRNNVAGPTGVSEYIEITLKNSEHARVSDFTLTLYQQSGNGTVFNLSDATYFTAVPHPTGEPFWIYTIVQPITDPDHDPPGPSEGEYEGIALADGSNVLTFFDIGGGSGTITALNGPAAGTSSTNIPPASGQVISFDIQGNRVDGDISETNSVVCFAGGTLLQTAKGEVAVEALRVGDLVMTRDRGLQPIRWIGSRRVSSAELMHQPKLRPVRIKANALGNAFPAQDLYVSRQHRILLCSKIVQRMTGKAETLVPAIKLVGAPGIDIVAGMGGVTYFHILFDQHEIVYSNGAPTESLFTGPEALAALPATAQEEINLLFPEGTAGLQGAKFVSQSTIHGKRIDRLVARHVKNKQAFCQIQGLLHVKSE